ncbi:MAG: NAD(P)-dependent glycerol-3-phosphate dehydrogenase [Acidimicrobiia bacterium]|nr:NAD(P)-dependent glycerol-3-phosphate dehydrogenase [Acidimicrobiia bacterium]
MEQLAVLGAGAWGTTVASLAASNTSAILWARQPELATRINADHENPDYLPGAVLPKKLQATSDIREAIEDAEAILVGVPSHCHRPVLKSARRFIPSSTPVISLAKGIEVAGGLRMSQVIAEVLEGHDPERIGALSGPNLSAEIMKGHPAATVVALPDPEAARRVQSLLSTPLFRVYAGTDVVGVEVAGSVKNVIAIAAGAAMGLGFGMNTVAALTTRGLAEMTRLGVALGGEILTFGGLAGVGDLMATCAGPLSRNHQVGRRLGEGQGINRILAKMTSVAEGVKTTRAVLDLAARHEVEMPITEAVGRIIYEGETVEQAMASLLDRTPKPETHGMTYGA